MRRDYQAVREQDTPLAGWWKTPAGICLIVAVAMTVFVVYRWPTPEYPNGGIPLLEDELRTSARTPVPQRMLTPNHMFVPIEQTDEQFDVRLLYRGWECAACKVQFVYRDHPVESKTLQFALKRVDENVVPEKRWTERRASAVRLMNMVQKQGVMAALFEIDGLYDLNDVGFLLRQEAKGAARLVPFDVMAPNDRKLLSIFTEETE